MFCFGANAALRLVGNLRRVALRMFPLSLLSLSACMTNSLYNGNTPSTPVVGSLSSTSVALAQLPPPPRRISVSVYDFPDLTGQRRPTAAGAVSELSTAVSQGSSSIVIEALRMTGGGTWFDVLDRTRDADQVRERTILAAATSGPGMRDPNRPDGGITPLPSAEYILNGGVMAFERSVVTNNTSGSFLGIGGSKAVVRNFVSVTLRLVRADTAEVVESVTAYRSIDNSSEGVASRSRLVSGIYPDSLLMKYPSPSDYFEGDLSRTRAEMVQIATREAIEAGLYELIGNAARGGLWERPARHQRTAALPPPPGHRGAPPRAKTAPINSGANQQRLPVTPTIPLPPPPQPQNQSVPLPPDARLKGQPQSQPQYSLLSPVLGPLY